MGGQVQVAVHVQVAVGVHAQVGHYFHAGAQVERIAVAAQAGQAAVDQRAVAQCGVDEGAALRVQAVEVGLVDDLVGFAAGGAIAAGGGAVVGDEGVELDRLRTVDGDRAASVDGHVVAAHARRIQGHRALAAVAAGHAQVHARATGDGQGAGARIDLDGGPVGRIDGHAVAVTAQHAGTGIEHRGAAQADPVARGQADAAGLFAAGIHGAVDGELAVVQPDVHLVRHHFVAQHQVAQADAEGARAGDAIAGEAGVEAPEIGDGLPMQVDPTGAVGHLGAAGIVMPAAAAEQRAGQVDGATGGTHPE
ncbi:hypothetical protein D3C71_1419730 [compost metagenome]